MNQVNLHPVSAPPKLSLADELKALRRAVGEREEAVRQTSAVIFAIMNSGLLDVLPEGEHERAQHNAAVMLLDLLRDRLAIFENDDYDPSFTLAEMETAASRGRLMRMVYHPE